MDTKHGAEDDQRLREGVVVYEPQGEAWTRAFPLGPREKPLPASPPALRHLLLCGPSSPRHFVMVAWQTDTDTAELRLGGWVSGRGPELAGRRAALPTWIQGCYQHPVSWPAAGDLVGRFCQLLWWRHSHRGPHCGVPDPGTQKTCAELRPSSQADTSQQQCLRRSTQGFWVLPSHYGTVFIDKAVYVLGTNRTW